MQLAFPNFGRSVQIDMVFTLPDDRALMVEYGAQCIVARKNATGASHA